MDARGKKMKQSNGRNVINTIHKWTGWKWGTETVTGKRATMMSYFGHEAIFTLDYAINENQMFDCLMPGQRGVKTPKRHPTAAQHHFKSAAIWPKCQPSGIGPGGFCVGEHFNYLYACLSPRLVWGRGLGRFMCARAMRAGDHVGAGATDNTWLRTSYHFLAPRHARICKLRGWKKLRVRLWLICC